jgi:hypothetical protein
LKIEAMSYLSFRGEGDEASMEKGKVVLVVGFRGVGLISASVI